MGIDVLAFQFVHGLTGWAGMLDTAGVFFAQYLPYLLGIAIIIFIFKSRSPKTRFKTFLFITLTALLSRGILTEAIGFFFLRPRPFDAFGFTPLISVSGASFPSGHAAFFFAVSFAIFAIDRTWGWWFFVLSVLNGLARVFVGVHYPLDVAGGFLVALVSYFVIAPIFKTPHAPLHEASHETHALQEEGETI